MECFLKKEHLASTVEINDEAGEVDGVIHLKLNASDEDPSEVASKIVNRHLRKRLPAGEFDAVFDEGSLSYLDAYEKMSQKRELGKVLTFLAPIFDLPMAVRCDECKTDPKTESANSPSLCGDCEVRNSTALIRGFENKLVEQFKPYGFGRPKHFQELAEAQILGFDDDRTSVHKPRLATVFADGNMIGERLKELKISLGDASTQAVSDEQRRAIQGIVCKALHTATTFSVESIVDKMTEPKELVRGGSAGKNGAAKSLPIVPHVVGGDDVLVTVPAQLGWFFTVRFLRTFQITVAGEYRAKVEENFESIPEDAMLGKITASAGLVFHHFSEPFDSVTDLSESLLRSAKSFTGGEKASIAWQDITQDGRIPLVDSNPNRRCWELRDLECPANDERLALLSDRHRVSTNTYREMVVLMIRRADIKESDDKEKIEKWKNDALNRMRRHPELHQLLKSSEDPAFLANLVETARWRSSNVAPI